MFPQKGFRKTISNYSAAKAQYDSAQPSTSSPYEKDYQSAMDTDAQECINAANTGCIFMQSNDGEIFITNGMGKSVWGLR
jgi:hypothetical protein